jgi:hypothetical protein
MVTLGRLKGRCRNSCSSGSASGILLGGRRAWNEQTGPVGSAMMSDQHDLDTSKDDSVGAFRN